MSQEHVAERDALARMLADTYWKTPGATETWEAWADSLMARGVRVTSPAEPCSTCGGQGSVPWMHESDPNLYQEPDADGRVPCPDCLTSPGVSA